MGIKTAYIHVGKMKTATTSIQSTLFENRELLERSNYLCPPASWPTNHGHALINIIAPNDPRYNDQNILHSKGLKEILRKNEEEVRSLKEVIDHSSAENIVFSSEMIYSIADKPGVLESLKKFIENVVQPEKIVIVVSLRELTSQLASEWQEAVKLGYRPLPIEKFIDSAMNYSAYTHLKYFIKVFGLENIIAYSFEEACKSAKGPVEFFFKAIGLADQTISQLDFKHKNEGVSDKALDVIRYINEIIPLLEGMSVGREKGDTALLESIRGNKFHFSSEEVACIEASNTLKKEAGWLEKTFGIKALNPRSVKVRESELVFDDLYYQDVIAIFYKLSATIRYYCLSYFEDKRTEIQDKQSQHVLTKIIDFIDKYDLACPPGECKVPFSIHTNHTAVERLVDQLRRHDTDSATVYRDAAIFLEQHGLITVAYQLMECARDIRPNGPFINQKFDYYKKLLCLCDSSKE